MSATRICITCEEELPLGQFQKHGGAKSGRRHQCRDCRQETSRKTVAISTYAASLGHRFGGDDLGCTNGDCRQTWFTQQEKPTVCEGPRRQSWGMRPGAKRRRSSPEVEI